MDSQSRVHTVCVLCTQVVIVVYVCRCVCTLFFFFSLFLSLSLCLLQVDSLRRTLSSCSNKIVYVRRVEEEKIDALSGRERRERRENDCV